VQVREPSRETVRRLAELRVDDGRVLSVYVNLDPSSFGTGPARSTAIRSVIDEASRRTREIDGDLSHEARGALRDDVARVREFLRGADLEGAHGLAVFAAASASLFETLRLPRAVENEVVIDTSPFVEPLVKLSPGGEWCVLLANRRLARILRGSAAQLTEVERFEDDVHGQHDQGGWSQARYQRSIDNEAVHHLRRSAEAAHRRFRRRRFDHLLLGAPEESCAALEKELHSELRARLRGRVEVDVQNSNVDHVLDAARPLIDEYERARQDELLDRLQEGLGRGERAAAGLEPVLNALNEQRVEALLLEDGFEAEGVRCPQCGWLGPGPSAGACPADGSELERIPDLAEAAVERAVRQDAEVVVLRERPELGPHGGIAAVLRF
jgi:peptide chain release factor subunit 1